MHVPADTCLSVSVHVRCVITGKHVMDTCALLESNAYCTYGSLSPSATTAQLRPVAGQFILGALISLSVG